MKIGLMSFRNAFALAPASFVLSIVGTPARAFAADSTKDVCLSSADQGQSLRDDGKYSSAREQFATCSRDVCPKLVHDQCSEWLHQLDEAMPTVVLGVKDDHGADVVTARAFADGKLIAPSLDGKPVALDPGSHDIRFERDAPAQSVSMHVVLRTGEKNREVMTAFPAVEGQAPPASEAPAPSPSSPTTPEVPEGSSTSSNGRTITSLALLGGGVVGVGLGVFFGLASQSDKNQAGLLRGVVGTGGCPTPSTNANCQQLSDKVDAQNREALVSDVLYVAGGVLAAGALVTWLLWPKSVEERHASAAWVAPMLGPASAGVRVGGAF
jgi:hypothetical protein